MTFTPEVDAALDGIEREKAGFIPPYLTADELAELNAAWERLYDDPEVEVSNARFITDHKMYDEPVFAKLATHPVVQEAVRRTIGDFQLAGYAVVATPRNGDTPTRIDEVPFHVDHMVYSNVQVSEARDTFVCVWINFIPLAIENGPFALAVGTHKWNIGMDFVRARGMTSREFGWERLTGFNVGPAGSTAVYSGKTWHAGTTNASDTVRRGLNLNFVPKNAQDSLRRNVFDLCALSPERYERLEKLIGIDEYLIPLGGEIAGGPAMG